MATANTANDRGDIAPDRSLSDEKDRGSKAEQNPFLTDPFGTIADAANPVNVFLGAFGIDADDVPKILERLGIIILGFVLFMIGIWMVMSGSRTAAMVKDTVKDVALDAIPAGKVAKIAKKVL